MSQLARTLDTSGLNCPLPLLRLKKALLEMQSGDIVEVLSTDPASVLDFGVFAEQTGHSILEQYQEDEILFYRIKKN